LAEVIHRAVTQPLRVAEIDWIEAAGVFVNLHVAGKEFLHRASLSDLAERPDPLRFIRIHRSAIVNIESILQPEPASHGEFEVVLKKRLTTSFRRVAFLAPQFHFSFPPVWFVPPLSLSLPLTLALPP
jgi:DNA-binding LytR/AlgR family response regulator